ncbi:hypothetical protein RhiXN_02452 [Rhizoctonia solani]|uniref:Uncharacterized protein n=1 Tax=Rhizoctonia solani TaxID=456999 RepID=A0A8H8NSG6_9AGAM|nr:uncharacterized protein RhiXN_02452 [Rhizoctonia solani]QRW17528.1 hypothetical protein RhiXN_02452 [Rhizoctonia solani]
MDQGLPPNKKGRCPSEEVPNYHFHFALGFCTQTLTDIIKAQPKCALKPQSQLAYATKGYNTPRGATFVTTHSILSMSPDLVKPPTHSCCTPA